MARHVFTADEVSRGGRTTQSKFTAAEKSARGRALVRARWGDHVGKRRAKKLSAARGKD